MFITILIILILFLWSFLLYKRITNIENVLKDVQDCQNKYYKKLNSLEKELKEIKNPTYETPAPVSELKENEVQEAEPVINALEYKENYSQNIKEKNYSSFENIFLGNIFTVIGVIAIITGFIIFIKLISPYIIFTPLLKTLIGFTTGIAMILGGLCMKKDSLKRFSEIMIGTGVSVLFTTVYLTTALFKTFSSGVCIILASLILIAAYYIADKQKTVSMIVIALIGGYLNIFFTNFISDVNLVFAYIIFLNLLSVVYVYKNPNKAVINIINLSATFVGLCFYAVPSIFWGGIFNVNLGYPLTLWAIYLVYDIIRKNKNPEVTDKINLLNWFNFGVLTVLSLLIFREERVNIGIFLLCVGLMYSGIIFYFVKTKLQNYRPYVYSMLITAFLSNFFMTEDLTRIIIWSVEAITLSYVLYKYKQNYLINWILTFLTAAMFNVLFVDGVISGYSDYIPILNKRLLTFIYPVLTAFFAYLIMKNNEDTKVKKISEIIRLGYISMIYLFIIFEINNFINSKILAFNTNEQFIAAMLYSIIGFRYAVQADKISFLNGSRLFKIAGMTISMCSLFTILIAGYKYNPVISYIPILNIRFIAYGAAITNAIIYARRYNFDIYKYSGLIIGFILLYTEVQDCIEKYYSNNCNYLISVSWLLYAAIITIIGILKKQKYLKNTGICISILAVIRIFFTDMNNINSIYRLITLIALGIIFMFTSYFYNKNKS